MAGAGQCTGEWNYSQFLIHVTCGRQMFGRYVWLIAEDLMASELVVYGYGESPPPPLSLVEQWLFIYVLTFMSQSATIDND